MPEPLQAVTYADPAPTPVFQRFAVSNLPFEATLTRLKEAIQAEDLWLIHEINPQMLLERGGYRIHATRQLLFFHPRYMVRLLEKDPNALVEVPLKLIIMQMPDGSVTLRHPDVATAFARYKGLEALGIELEIICQRLMASVIAVSET